MKVLLIDVNYKYSSTGKIVYDLFNFINKSGNFAAVCYGRGDIVDEEAVYKFGIDSETRIHALLTRLTGLTGCFSYFSTKRLINYIEIFKPDVVHIHELHAYFVNLKPLISYLKQKQIPIVWTFHCEFMYTGKCGVAYECNRYTTGCGKCPHLKIYPKTWLFDFTHYMWKQKRDLLSDYNNLVIVTPSQWLANRTKLSFLGRKDIRVIHNGIDTTVFRPCAMKEDLKAEYGIKENKIVLAVASHITTDSNKGAKFIYKLADELANENIHFVLVGADEKKITTQRNITIVPAIKNQQKLARLYSGADVFLICSEKENFPTTLMEAQCCGTPVCGFDVGGVKETIVSEAYLCEYGDMKGLKENLLVALNSKYDSSKALSYFSKENMLNKYLYLYKTVRRKGEGNAKQENKSVDYY